MEPIVIDGSIGEGGGQILRTSLSLAMATGRSVRLERIRANRAKPGLMRQHLTAVLAAAEICGGRCVGAEVGSRELTFEPGPVRPGTYEFRIGTAGSTTLVLQTVLPVLLTAAAPSRIVLEGGTHNSMSPSVDFLRAGFLPVIRRMGPTVDIVCERAGFYPAGGGRIVAEITPCAALAPVELLERGAIRRREAVATITGLPPGIALREVAELRSRLKWDEESVRVDQLVDGHGPGNVVTAFVESEHVSEVFVAFGRIGATAEHVAGEVVDEVRAYLAADVPVWTHLADQLLVPMALAGGGAFVTGPLSPHATTNIDVIGRFLDVAFDRTPLDGAARRTRVALRRTARETARP